MIFVWTNWECLWAPCHLLLALLTIYLFTLLCYWVFQASFFCCRFFVVCLFWWHVGGILVPQPEIEPVPPAVEAQSLNPWTAREVPPASF